MFHVGYPISLVFYCALLRFYHCILRTGIDANYKINLLTYGPLLVHVIVPFKHIVPFKDLKHTGPGIKPQMMPHT